VEIIRFFVASAVACAMPIFAFATPAICPPVLNLSAHPKLPAGFTLYKEGNPPAPAKPTPTQNLLDGALFSEDSPDKQVLLAPDTEGSPTSEWDFRADEDQNVWISCTYAGTDFMLAKPMPAGISVCTITDSKQITVLCR
jgi:hypothetical protein